MKADLKFGIDMVESIIKMLKEFKKKGLSLEEVITELNKTNDILIEQMSHKVDNTTDLNNVRSKK